MALLPQLPQEVRDQCIAAMRVMLPGVDDATLNNVLDSNTKIVQDYMTQTYFPSTANT